MSNSSQTYDRSTFLRANAVIRDAIVLEDWCHEHSIDHLQGCAIGYNNGADCDCGLPELRVSLRLYDRQKVKRNVR